ncbi:hypothetical protein FBY20_0189 [Achromobacter sp. SLBN-14]|nr:hypothetical protein FBY20_0189 [Achromobacter sp. SLBN-14]
MIASGICTKHAEGPIKLYRHEHFSVTTVNQHLFYLSHLFNRLIYYLLVESLLFKEVLD